MKMNKKLLVLGATIAIAAQFGTIAMADVVDGSVSATVFTPLAISETQAMYFGTVAGGPAIGTVIMTTAGARSTTGDAQVIASDPGLPGTLDITGEGNAAITVTITDSVATLEDGGAGDDMGFTLTSPSLPTTIDASGTESMSFGGTLSIGINQLSGAYATVLDTYQIQVDYN